MSLTDQAGLREMFIKPVKKKHNPHFMGDKELCDYKTGHCTNTTARHDCKVYQSTIEVRKYESDFKGE